MVRVSSKVWQKDSEGKSWSFARLVYINLTNMYDDSYIWKPWTVIITYYDNVSTWMRAMFVLENGK